MKKIIVISLAGLALILAGCSLNAPNANQSSNQTQPQTNNEQNQKNNEEILPNAEQQNNNSVEGNNNVIPSSSEITANKTITPIVAATNSPGVVPPKPVTEYQCGIATTVKGKFSIDGLAFDGIRNNIESFNPSVVKSNYETHFIKNLKLDRHLYAYELVKLNKTVFSNSSDINSYIGQIFNGRQFQNCTIGGINGKCFFAAMPTKMTGTECYFLDKNYAASYGNEPDCSKYSLPNYNMSFLWINGVELNVITRDHEISILPGLFDYLNEGYNELVMMQDIEAQIPADYSASLSNYISKLQPFVDYFNKCLQK